MNRRSFLARLAALGTGIVVVGPSVLAEVQRHLRISALDYPDARVASLANVYESYGGWPLRGRIVAVDRKRKIITFDAPTLWPAPNDLVFFAGSAP